MDMAQLGKGMMHPRVKAQVAPWKLPCWPQPGRVRRELERSWRQWAAKHRLPPRVHHRVQGCLASQVDLLQLQPPPPCWQQAEDEIHHVMAESEVLTWDDQDSTKAWALKRAEAGVHIINSMLLDVDTWVYTPGITPQTVLYWYSARTQAGLPDFLVRRRQPHRQPSPPTLFLFAKSNCYADSGHWKCGRRLHNCWRRIINMARIPYAREWKLIGRALRAVVEMAGASHEIFNISQVAPNVKQGLASLTTPSSCSCRRCGRHMGGQLHVSTFKRLKAAGVKMSCQLGCGPKHGLSWLPAPAPSSLENGGGSRLQQAHGNFPGAGGFFDLTTSRRHCSTASYALSSSVWAKSFLSFSAYALGARSVGRQ